MKRNFLYQITAASRLGGYRSQIPVLSVLCPQLNLLNPPTEKIPGYATAHTRVEVMFSQVNCIAVASAQMYLYFVEASCL